MSDKLLPLSHCGQTLSDGPVAYHAGQYYSRTQFVNAVKYWTGRFEAQSFRQYALYTEDAYPFAVLLFALLHAGKQIYIPGNNRPGTAAQLESDCRLVGDWHDFDYCLDAPEDRRTLSPLDPLADQLVIFTSGSTGEAKPIVKCLNQFQLEIEALERQWGELLGEAAALATVSHQHIYGLLFRVLWPLAAGRCFHSSAYISPEALVHAASQPAYWIASPAHLKRLDHQSPWAGLAGLAAIFSSGGALPEPAAKQIQDCSGQAVIEVYGSSETGGIAWRRQDQAWTLFPAIKLNCVGQKWLLHSPYLTAEQQGMALDDRITLLDDGRFMLHGRSDRIVKIEEKRLSLAELEQRLAAEPWIDEAHALVISKSRDIVAVAVVLSGQGLEQLHGQGRNRLIRQLRQSLGQWFESVVLPRKWLFVDAMPLTSQGKVDRRLLTSLLDFDNRKLPQVLNVETAADSIRLGLKVPEDLVYFPDHFADFPLLPGVVQLAWAEHFGKLFFTIARPFSDMEAIKFTEVIRPGDLLTLSLEWKDAAGKLYFKFSSERGAHSSGRMVYLDDKNV
jgi:acyl-CoA synthetase (AMP-forming)/AMP-acid ligase II/3-hydroxymyristoyl/3-hydroxydecanoyl-(acyl carrier protein) dehydratase